MTKRRLTFIDRIARMPPYSLPSKAITAWLPIKRPRGIPKYTTRNYFKANFLILFPDLPEDANLSSWAHYARDPKFWKYLIKNLDNNPQVPRDWTPNTGFCDPNDNGSPCSPHSRLSRPPPPSTRPNNAPLSPQPISSPPQSPPTSPTSPSSTFTATSSPQTILELPKNPTLRHVKTNYRRLARLYHPDKWSARNTFTQREGVEKFKAISNAYEIMREKCDD